jgi:hypothetical protein
MKVYITYLTVWCGEELDDYAIADIVSINTKPLTDDEIKKQLTKYSRRTFCGDSVIVKNDNSGCNEYEPNYTAYENQDKANKKDENDEFVQLFYVNKPYELTNNIIKG